MKFLNMIKNNIVLIIAISLILTIGTVIGLDIAQTNRSFTKMENELDRLLKGVENTKVQTLIVTMENGEVLNVDVFVPKESFISNVEIQNNKTPKENEIGSQ